MEDVLIHPPEYAPSVFLRSYTASRDRRPPGIPAGNSLENRPAEAVLADCDEGVGEEDEYAEYGEYFHEHRHFLLLEKEGRVVRIIQNFPKKGKGIKINRVSLN